MRKNKKFLTFMVAASLCAVQFAPPMSMIAFAEEQTLYTGTCGAEGDNITWTYDASTQTMTFSGTGDMENYEEYYNQHHTDKIPEWRLIDEYIVTNIVVEDGITGLADSLLQVLTDDVLKSNTPVTLTAPNSLVGFEPRDLGKNYTVYADYGSYAYYYTPHKHFVATGVWEDSPYATSGVSEDGAYWELDYETGTLTISGPGSMYISSIATGFQPVQMLYGESLKAVVIENDFDLGKVREAPASARKAVGYDFVESEFLATLSTLFENELEWDYTIYYYKDNPNAYLFENTQKVVTWKRGFCKTHQFADCVALPVKEPACGDLSLDGKINLMDAIYLNKYTAKVVSLSDAQKAAADCDGDGSVTDTDVTTLMEFLLFQIPSLPYTDAES